MINKMKEILFFIILKIEKLNIKCGAYAYYSDFYWFNTFAPCFFAPMGTKEAFEKNVAR